MDSAAAGEQGVDTGLMCLVLMLRFVGVPADPAQLRRRFGNLAERISPTDILRTARELGLKSRVVKSHWARLTKSPWPAIAATKEGGFFILAKVAEDKALIHDSIENRPVTMSRPELEASWNGKLISVAKRASLAEVVRKFDLAWFIPAIFKYKRILVEVLVASFALQKGLTPKMEMLTIQQQLIEMQRDRDAAQAHLSESKAQIASIERQKAQAEEEFERDRLKELADAETQASALDQELRKAEERQRLKSITTPVAGTVQQLSVHTLGGMIQPGQALLAIVPEDTGIEIEAMVQNQDIGFVAEGQEAVIKLDAFPFTRYGTLPGNIKVVSEDAVGGAAGSDEQQRSDQSAKSATSSSSQLVYAARVTLDQTMMNVDGKEVRLTPGMAAVVEIKTGKRKLIEYLLSPLMRITNEAGRER